jgi:CDP-diacylglycerol--glycerol-3-phosphate 3-phosphatidyltransferase
MAYAIFYHNLTWIYLIALMAYLSDISDGYLARKLNCQSETGKIIDPLADKIFVGVTTIIMFIVGILPVWFVCFILGRDLIILTGGILLTKKIRKVAPSNITGKITMVILGVTLLLALSSVDPIYKLIAMYVSSAFLIYSLIVYLNRAIKLIKNK